jgi:hypothetical protein
MSVLSVICKSIVVTVIVARVGPLSIRSCQGAERGQEQLGRSRSSDQCSCSPVVGKAASTTAKAPPQSIATTVDHDYPQIHRR